MTSTSQCVGQSPSNETQSEQSTLVTDHLALAAFLLSKGYDPMLKPSASGTVLFVFQQTPALAEAVSQFSSGTALVGPAAYDGARIALRKRMDALKGGGR
jgi:hypothetical protein